MWTCPLCSRQFVNSNQQHSCNDKTVADFLNGKSQHSISLYWHFIKCYEQIGDIAIQPTKTMIAVAAKTRFAYITRIGKDFIDIVFPFKESYNDNLCFHKNSKSTRAGTIQSSFSYAANRGCEFGSAIFYEACL
jgi:hypothetical protein